MICKRFARCIPSYVFGGVIERAMDTNDEVRRRRLSRLIAKTEGGLKGVAQRAGLSAQALGQLLKITHLPKKKTSDEQSRKCMGNPAARALERAYELLEGWMDWPLEAVDYEVYQALSDFNKATAQARFMQAIKELSQPEKLVNIHASTVVTNAPNQESASYSGQTESDSSAKNSDKSREKFRAATEDLRDLRNASNKHVGVPRKRGGRST